MKIEVKPNLRIVPGIALILAAAVAALPVQAADGVQWFRGQ